MKIDPEAVLEAARQQERDGVPELTEEQVARIAVIIGTGRVAGLPRAIA